MKQTCILAIMILSACKQGVTVDLEADPEFVCLPGETELRWDVNSVGTPTINIDVTTTDSRSFLFPNLPHETSNAADTLDLAIPAGRSEFTLTASASGRSSSESVSVIGVGSESLPGSFIFEPECTDTGDFDGWSSVEMSSYDSAISPRGVTNTSDRPIVISHAGVSLLLEPGTTSSAWNRTQLNGQWSVSATLLNRASRGADIVTESCDPDVGPGGTVSAPAGDSSRTVRVNRLTAAFTFGCDG